MKRHIPNRWVVVELRPKGKDITVQKVLCSWHGGYAWGDEWKLSGEIVTTNRFDDRYEFLTHSGSVYECYFSAYGLSGIMADTIRGIEEAEIVVEIMGGYDDQY